MAATAAAARKAREPTGAGGGGGTSPAGVGRERSEQVHMGRSQGGPSDSGSA